MAPKRLSETEKQEIADRYRQPDESTATLSRAFGVSTSTIGRLLKNSFSADEYEALVQQKRLIGRGGATRFSTPEPASEPAFEPASEPASESGTDETESAAVSSTVVASPVNDGKPQQAAPKLRSRTRSRSRSRTSTNSTDSIATSTSDTQLGLSLESHNTTRDTSISSAPSIAPDGNEADKRELASRRRRRRSSVTQASNDTRHQTEVTQPPTIVRHLIDGSSDAAEESLSGETPIRSRKRRSRHTAISSMPEMGLERTESFQKSREDEAQSTSDFEESRWDHAGFDDSSDRSDEPPQAKPAVEILELTSGSQVSSLASPPLSEATLPKTCYLVVDRLSELISRPLQDFEELGEIPQGEHQEQTLPIFDNHRVARRFANRSQRVMKIPDSRVLQKTGAHLQAKGITRVLIDGKVYSLS